MNQDIAARWVSALRSGKYEQGKNLLKQLHDSGKVSYCCLGVLCDLYLQEYPDSAYTPDLRPDLDRPTRENGTPYAFGEKEVELPPKDIQTWAGINPHQCDALAEQNDSGSTFEELADLIEKSAQDL